MFCSVTKGISMHSCARNYQQDMEVKGPNGLPGWMPKYCTSVYYSIEFFGISAIVYEELLIKFCRSANDFFAFLMQH